MERPNQHVENGTRDPVVPAPADPKQPGALSIAAGSLVVLLVMLLVAAGIAILLTAGIFSLGAEEAAPDEPILHAPDAGVPPEAYPPKPLLDVPPPPEPPAPAPDLEGEGEPDLGPEKSPDDADGP